MNVDFAQFFKGPEHQPFMWEGGEPAALLVHGFPGTPAEMRPLGEALHQAGWTVQGLLLPGFGVEINSLINRRHHEWLAAVRWALVQLQRNHRPVMIGGFSMGAALALAAAATERPTAQVLLAPFWKLPGPLWGLLPVVRRVVPTIRPFRLIKPDFSDPEMRRGMTNFMPDLDLDDPQVQQGIRDFAVPVGIFDEVRQVGKLAWRLAPVARADALVIQGTDDELVTRRMTRRLLERMRSSFQYQEVAAAHDLYDPDKPAWPQIAQAVMQFGKGVERQQAGKAKA